MKDKKIIAIFLMIILLLLVNTFAWFIFNENVNIKIDTKVKSWNINFTENDKQITDTTNLEIESIYPGMQDENKTIVIKNNGEVASELEYKIKSIELFGERKAVGENCTQEEMDEYIKSLPFEIKIEQEKDELEGNGEETNIKVTLSWPLGENEESDEITEKDKLDTEYGEKAYNYLLENEGNTEFDGYNFKLELELIAKQKT